MGAAAAPPPGSDFTSWKSVVNIAPRHWRLGTTGICHMRRKLCQLSSSDGSPAYCRTATQIECRQRRRTRPAINVLHVSRKLLNSKGGIVIVESDDLIRELLQRWLGEAGYGVILPGKDHNPGLVMPRLVIADISSPDSAETTVKELAAAYSAPILALSSRFRQGLGGSEAAAHRHHVCKVLPKPFSREELLY